MLNMPSPLYRFDCTFEENAKLGPRFDGTLPIVPTTPKKEFLGYRVNSRFGIAAGPGINSKWISLYSNLGFDLLTYKTVRLHERIAHSAPNFVFLESKEVHPGQSEAAIASANPTLPLNLTPTGGSIGTPSLPPDFWVEDIAIAKKSLCEGQLLIVSILGTSYPGISEEAFIDEFAILAKMVADAGADVVEANLSCPNVHPDEGEVYKDPTLCKKISLAIRKAIDGLPLLLKIGYGGDKLKPFLHAVNGIAHGVVIMNALAHKIENSDGTPYFGPGRHIAGLHGGGLFPIALQQVKLAREIIRADKLALEIIGVGGASTVERANAFLNAGAAAALIGSSALLLPNIAINLKTKCPDF